MSNTESGCSTQRITAHDYLKKSAAPEYAAFTASLLKCRACVFFRHRSACQYLYFWATSSSLARTTIAWLDDIMT